MKRILINENGPIPEAVKQAFLAAAREATQNDSRCIILLVPAKDQFQSTVPAQFLGKKLSGELLRNGGINLTDSLRLELHTLGTLKKRQPGEEMLAIHVSPEAIEEATSSKASYKTCVYLPWMLYELKAWQQLPPDEIKEVKAWPPK